MIFTSSIVIAIAPPWPDSSQSAEPGSAGSGYSVTPFGTQWLSESNADLFVPTEPERFGGLLDPFKNRFGPAFHERAQEAIRC